MKYRFTVELLNDAFSRKEEWRRVFSRNYRLQESKRVADLLAPALRDAEEQYGTSSEEARLLRQLIDALA